MNIDHINIVYIKNNNQKNKEILKKAYPLLKRSFFIEGELPSLTFLEKLLKRNYNSASRSSIDKNYKHQEAWIMGLNKNKIVLTLNYDLIYIGNNKYAAAIVYFVIDPKYRKKGIGRSIISNINEEFEQYLIPNLNKKSKKKPLFIGSFIEVHDESKMSKAEKTKDKQMNKLSAKQRLNFWLKNNFKKIDINYIQGAMPKNKEVTNLSLYFKSHKNYNLNKDDLINYLTQFTEFCISNKKESKKSRTLQDMIIKIQEDKSNHFFVK